MSREEVLTILQRYKQQHADQYGIRQIGIFGSMAWGDVTDQSDVDVVIKLDTPDLFTMAGIKSDLEEALHRPVDIISYREQMNSFLKSRIDQGAIYV